jgi:hypothetical protein
MAEYTRTNERTNERTKGLFVLVGDGADPSGGTPRRALSTSFGRERLGSFGEASTRAKGAEGLVKGGSICTSIRPGSQIMRLEQRENGGNDDIRVRVQGDHGTVAPQICLG